MNISPDIVQLAVICSVAAWGVIEGVKPVLAKIKSDAWRKTVTRIAALVCGAAFGFAQEQSAQAAIIGLCGGAMSATTVAALHAWVARKQRSKIETAE